MRWFPNPRNDARHTRIHRSRAHRAARPDRGRGGIAASDARRSDDAAPGRLRISGVPWVFSREFIVFVWRCSGAFWPETPGWGEPRQSLKTAAQAWTWQGLGWHTLFRNSPASFSLTAMDSHEPRSRPYRRPIPDCAGPDGVDCTHPACVRGVARRRSRHYRDLIGRYRSLSGRNRSDESVDAAVVRQSVTSSFS